MRQGECKRMASRPSVRSWERTSAGYGWKWPVQDAGIVTGVFPVDCTRPVDANICQKSLPDGQVDHRFLRADDAADGEKRYTRQRLLHPFFSDLLAHIVLAWPQRFGKMRRSAGAKFRPSYRAASSGFHATTTPVRQTVPLLATFAGSCR